MYNSVLLWSCVSVVAAFVISVIIGPPMIKYLRGKKMGQKILSYVPEHAGKSGTPTMGGFIFIISITVVVIAANLIVGNFGVPAVTVLVLSLCYGVIGLIDDAAKLRHNENAGLTPKQKAALQLVLALVFLSVLHIAGDLTPSLYIPFFNVSFDIPWLVYVLLAAFIMVGGNNAVNLTDGLDGLAAGVTLPVALFFLAIGIISRNPSVALFSAALAGGLLGFLVFNFNPAKVFMGDTGSLFLGGAVVGLAFACDMPLVLILVGLVYICETLSVIIQVTVFRFTRYPVYNEDGTPVLDKRGRQHWEGKHLFPKTPIHHSFQIWGWSERKIVLLFGGITALLCVLAYFGVAPRYL